MTENTVTPDVSAKPDSDEIHEVVEQSLASLADAATDEEKKARVRSYLDDMADLGLFSYSFRNQMSLRAQIHARDNMDLSGARHFHGFWTWQNDYNRAVKEGETGFKVLAPGMTGKTCPHCGCTPDYHADNEWMECPNAGTAPDQMDCDPYDEWTEGVVYWTTETTFAYSQTEPVDDPDGDVWEPLDIRATGDGSRLWDAGLTLAREWGIDVAVKPEPGTRDGHSTGDNSVVVDDGLDRAQQAATLIHEIAHERLHSEAERQEMDKEAKEVEADAVAYVVGRYFGLDMSNRELYVARWNDDPDGLRGRLESVADLAETMIREISENAAPSDADRH